MVEDVASDNGVWHPDIVAAYEGSDLDAVVLSSAGLNAEDVVSNLPDMQTPVLLLAGSNEDPIIYSGMALAAKQST